MTKLTVVVGLPGSGKSEYVKSVKENYDGICVEDFHANAINDSPLFKNSRYYSSLINDLRNGRNCIIADIEYCNAIRRVEVINEIKSIFPETQIEWIFFENDPAQCCKNVIKRGRLSVNEEIEKVMQLSQNYEIPPNVKKIPVKSQ